MGNSDKITARQLYVLAFVSLLSPIIRVLPRASLIFAGNAAWLCAIPAAVVGIVYLLLIKRFFKNSQPGEGLAELSIKSFGKVGGRAFLVLCALWLVLYAGFITRSAAERLLSAVYQDGSTPVLIAVSIFVALIASSGTTRALVRTGEVFSPIIILVLAFVILFSLQEVNVEYLLPVTYMDAGGILAGSVHIIDIIGVQTYFLFLAGHIKDRENIKKQSVKWMLVEMLAAFGILVVTVGAFAPELTLKFQNAFFMVIRNITVLSVVERIEALIIGVWIITDFTLLASVIMIIGEIMKTVFSTQKRKPFVIPSGILAAFLAVFMVPDAFDLQRWNNLYIPVLNLAFTFVLIPLVLVVGLARKKL